MVDEKTNKAYIDASYVFNGYTNGRDTMTQVPNADLWHPIIQDNQPTCPTLEVFKVTTGKDLIKNCTDAQIHALHDKMMPLFSPPTKTSGLFKKGLAKAVMNDIETLFQWKL